MDEAVSHINMSNEPHQQRLGPADLIDTAPIEFGVSDAALAEASKQRFAESGRTQIFGFTVDTAARLLREELLESNEWRHAISGDGKAFEIGAKQFDAMDAESRTRIIAALHSEAREGFRYRFDRINVPGDSTDLPIGAPMLGSFARFVQTDNALEFFREVTGCPELRYADAQATRYRRGDFLTRHDDSLAERRRRFAYVFGLTPGWRPEWGGLLQFNEGDCIVDTMVPTFNSLCLFSVPQQHSVSFVAPYAGLDRLAVTGWLFDEVAR